MAKANIQSDDQPVDTDVFVVVEKKDDSYDFVTIDENASFDAIVIDMSQSDFADAIIVDFDADDPSDSFVTIDEDEDQVFVSDFTADDLLFGF